MGKWQILGKVACTANTDIELSLVQSGKMFRCSKCGKVKLARDVTSGGVCKTCHA